MTESARRPPSFNNGIIFALAVMSLVQDCYGKERYLHHVEEHWIDWYYSVPVAILVVLFALWSEVKER